MPEKNLSGKGILLVLYERLSLWESSREAGERAIRREQAPALRRGTPPINRNLKIFRSPFPLKKGAFTVEDSLVGINMDQETSEMEEISMASPSRAAVKKSKRMTLS